MYIETGQMWHKSNDHIVYQNMASRRLPPLHESSLLKGFKVSYLRPNILHIRSQYFPLFLCFPSKLLRNLIPSNELSLSPSLYLPLSCVFITSEAVWEWGCALYEVLSLTKCCPWRCISRNFGALIAHMSARCSKEQSIQLDGVGVSWWYWWCDHIRYLKSSLCMGFKATETSCCVSTV